MTSDTSSKFHVLLFPSFKTAGELGPTVRHRVELANQYLNLKPYLGSMVFSQILGTDHGAEAPQSHKSRYYLHPVVTSRPKTQ